LSSGREVVEALDLVSKKFVCEICGTEYDTEQDAAMCAVDCVE